MHPGTGCGSGTEGTLKRAGGTWQQHAVTPFRRHPSVPWHGGGLLHTVCREPIGRNERLEGLQQLSSESLRHLWVCGCPEARRERMALMAVQLWACDRSLSLDFRPAVCRTPMDDSVTIRFLYIAVCHSVCLSISIICINILVQGV
jgi:hypothetical protein